MNYNLMPVKYFVDVVQTRGFSSAAKRNYVSETAVSLAVNKLEKELGHRLLNRSAGQFELTPNGKAFYKRAVEILLSYSEIWRHPDEVPSELLRVHFLQGMGSEAALFAQQLPDKYRLSFDEEVFASSVSRLLDENYDILIGFLLGYQNNAKLVTYPLRTVSFDLIFNQTEVEATADLQTLARQSRLYMQNWQSTGVNDVQQAMLSQYHQRGWAEKDVAEVNSFEAACLSVNFRGGMAMVPDSFLLPNYCENIYRVSPAHLQDAFCVVATISASREDKLGGLIQRSISSTNQ